MASVFQVEKVSLLTPLHHTTSQKTPVYWLHTANPNSTRFSWIVTEQLTHKQNTDLKTNVCSCSRPWSSSSTTTNVSFFFLKSNFPIFGLEQEQTDVRIKQQMLPLPCVLQCIFLPYLIAVTINTITANCVTGQVKFIVCEYWSCQATSCCHQVHKYHFLKEMSSKCSETLRVACQTSKELQYMKSVNFHLLPSSSVSNVASLKSSFPGRMTGPTAKIPIERHDTECVTIMAFWDVMSCSLVDRHQTFERTCHLHLQCRSEQVLKHSYLSTRWQYLYLMKTWFKCFKHRNVT